MASWSRKRKTVYAAIAIILVVVAVGLPAFFLFYTPPSCTDGKKNGNEQDVDCGGSCERLCPNAFLPPQVAWTRYEMIAPGIYNMAAYIVNPNTNAEARNVPYKMTIYDKEGVPIAESKGTVTIPAHRNTLAFRSAINLGKSIPASRVFEFTGIPQWSSREDPLKSLSYNSGRYAEDDSGSSFSVELKNNGTSDIGRTAVYVVLRDKDQNVVGFSGTVVDEILARQSVTAPFTWPINRNGSVISQEVLPVTE